MSSNLSLSPPAFDGSQDPHTRHCKLSGAIKLTIQYGFALFFSACVAFLPCQAADDWKKVTPTIGVDVSMHGKIEEVRKDGKKTGYLEKIESDDGKYRYTVSRVLATSETSLDDSVDEFKEEYTEKDFKNSTKPVDSSGKQWSGKLFQVSKETGDTLSVQIALDDENEELVTQSTTAPPDSAEAKKFFSSLQIDPEAVRTERTKRFEAALKKFFSPNNPIGWLSIGMSIIGVLSMGLGLICMIIVAFRTSLLWGLAIFIPGGIGTLLFVVCNFHRAWAPLALQIFGIVAIGIALAMTLPSMGGTN